MNKRREARAEGKRHGDSHDRNQQGRAAIGANVPAFKLQADQEEQKNQPDLGNDREDLHEHRIGQGGVEAGQGRPEERGEEIGGEPPEKRRAEQEAGRDLADHARLLEAACRSRRRAAPPR